MPIEPVEVDERLDEGAPRQLRLSETTLHGRVRLVPRSSSVPACAGDRPRRWSRQCLLSRGADRIGARGRLLARADFGRRRLRHARARDCRVSGGRRAARGHVRRPMPDPARHEPLVRGGRRRADRRPPRRCARLRLRRRVRSRLCAWIHGLVCASRAPAARGPLASPPAARRGRRDRQQPSRRRPRSGGGPQRRRIERASGARASGTSGGRSPFRPGRRDD